MNNQAHTTLIIANLWFVGAWLVDGMFAWISMIIMSLIWMMLSFKASHDELKFLRYKQLLLLHKQRLLQDIQEQEDFIKRCQITSAKLVSNKPKPKRKKKK